MNDKLSFIAVAVLDKVIAIALLMLFLPVLALLSLALLITTRGPVLNLHGRLGHNRRPFKLAKFNVFKSHPGRDALEDGEISGDGTPDLQFSRLGWLLRKTRFEDLPMLYNLLVGDLTIVGPAPDRKYFEDLFADDVDSYDVRFSVRPGMTGWAQVHGLRDENLQRSLPSVEYMRRRAEFDLEYIQNPNLLMDARVLVRTLLGLLLLRPLGEEGKLNQIYQIFSNSYTITGKQDRDQLISKLDASIQPTVVSFLNAHGFNVAWTEKRFQTALEDSDYVLRDGVGMKIAMRLFGRRPGLNMNGTDFIPELLKRQKSRRIAILGTCDPWLSEAVSKLKAGGLNVVWNEHGFHPPSYYLDKVGEHTPELIILAMGMPKQEFVAAALKKKLERPCVIVNGGAVVDFIAGRVDRAPRLVRELGLEWLFRLSREPRRLFLRYIVGNPLFLYRILLMRVRHGYVGLRQSVLGPWDGSSTPHPEKI